MLERVRRETTRLQPRLTGDRQRPLRLAWDYDATSARFALEARLAWRRSVGHGASAPNQSRDLPQTGSALSGRARDSVHKWFPSLGRANVRASAAWVPAFPPPAELRRARWTPQTVGGQLARRRESRRDCKHRQRG